MSENKHKHHHFNNNQKQDGVNNDIKTEKDKTPTQSFFRRNKEKNVNCQKRKAVQTK